MIRRALRLTSNKKTRMKLLRVRNSQSALLAAFAVGLLIASAIFFWAFESASNEQVPNVGAGFKWVTLTLLEQSSPWDIVTSAGTVIYYVVLVAGVGLAAIATGAIASKLLEYILRKGSGMGEAKWNNHIVICGWSSKGEEILRELHAEEVEDKRPIVILAPIETNPTRDELVTFIRGNPSSSEDLLRAGIDRADTAIILADTSNPSQSSDDMDAKTLLTTLAVESVNPNCYSCVEVVKSENRQHFERTNADELVVSAELTGALLASSAITHGLSRVVTDLITHPVGNEFYYIPTPESIVGRTFADALTLMKKEKNCILMAVATDGTEYIINPSGDRAITASDRLLVIAQTEFGMSQLK